MDYKASKSTWKSQSDHGVAMDKEYKKSKESTPGTKVVGVENLGSKQGTTGTNDNPSYASIHSNR